MATETPLGEAWAVFVFRDELFLVDEKTLERLPVLHTWWKWQRHELCATQQTLARQLGLDAALLPYLDERAVYADVFPTAGHLRALLAWARTNQLEHLMDKFTYDEAHRVADMMCSYLGADEDGAIRANPGTPPYLTEVLRWRARRPPDQDHLRGPMYALVRSLLWLTPSDLVSVAGFLCYTFFSLLCLTMLAASYAAVCHSDAALFSFNVTSLRPVSNAVDNVVVLVARFILSLVELIVISTTRIVLGPLRLMEEMVMRLFTDRFTG